MNQNDLNIVHIDEEEKSIYNDYYLTPQYYITKRTKLKKEKEDFENLENKKWETREAFRKAFYFLGFFSAVILCTLALKSVVGGVIVGTILGFFAGKLFSYVGIIFGLIIGHFLYKNN
jgi:hypothetical protein